MSNVEELKEMLEKFKASLPKFPQNKLEEFWMYVSERCLDLKVRFIFEYNREDKNKKFLQLDDACFFLDLILNGKKHIATIILFLKVA